MIAIRVEKGDGDRRSRCRKGIIGERKNVARVVICGTGRDCAAFDRHITVVGSDAQGRRNNIVDHISRR